MVIKRLYLLSLACSPPLLPPNSPFLVTRRWVRSSFWTLNRFACGNFPGVIFAALLAPSLTSLSSVYPDLRPSSSLTFDLPPFWSPPLVRRRRKLSLSLSLARFFPPIIHRLARFFPSSLARLLVNLFLSLAERTPLLHLAKSDTISEDHRPLSSIVPGESSSPIIRMEKKERVRHVETRGLRAEKIWNFAEIWLTVVWWRNISNYFLLVKNNTNLY